MPELKQMTGPVTDLKLGDKTTYGKVIAVDPKVKWAVVTFQGAQGPYEQRLLKDSLFDFSREVPTAEELAAKALERTLWTLDMKERQARENLAHYRAKMIENMQAGARAYWADWMDVPAAERIVDLWDAVAHVHLMRAHDETPMTRVEAVKFVEAERTKRALSYYRAQSRSTSVVSNLFDDMEVEALSTWRRSLEYLLFEE